MVEHYHKPRAKSGRMRRVCHHDTRGAACSPLFIRGNMDYLSILQSFAFPVAACIIMAWYVKYITDENNKRLDQVNADHKQEVHQLSEVIQTNTLAIQKLTDFIMHDVRVNNDDGR